jgi:hypothetical protein
MKEGYLQLKISELNEKCTQIDTLLSMENSKLQLLAEKVGEYKELIKKIQNIQDFKTQVLGEIREGNEKVLKDQVEQVSRRLTEVLNELVKSNANKIDKTVQFLKQREDELFKQAAVLDQHARDLTFLLEHTELLMMKLVNKNVVSGSDASEIHRRATKKAEKKE